MALSSAFQISISCALALVQAVIRAQLELPADKRPLCVDGAAHAVPVERYAPPIVEAAHHLAAPVIFIDEAFRDASVGQQQYFEATTARGAATAADRLVGQLAVGNGRLSHRGSLRVLHRDSCRLLMSLRR